MKKKLVAIVLVLVLMCLQSFESNAITVHDTLMEEEISTELLSGDFEEDSVVVTFKKEYSDYNRVFSPEDFPDIECESVEDLNDFARNDIAVYREKIIVESNKSNVKSTNQLNISDEEIIEKLNINVDNYMNCLCIKLKEKSKLNVLKTIKKLEKYEEVLSVGPNYRRYLNSVYPDDPGYTDNSNNRQWAIDAIQLPDAWDIGTGSSDIKVGVIDTGVDSSHPDLFGNLNNHDYVFFDDPDLGNDTLGHGTQMAGIIGADTDNLIGVAGTCWNVDLISLKSVEDVDGKSNVVTSRVVAAINQSKMLNLDILNLSLGGYDFDVNEKNAINSFNGLVVCAAGNGKDINNDGVQDRAVDTDTTKFYPSCYDCDNIISVTSFNSTGSYVESEVVDDTTIYYNYGSNTVDLAAPGSNIVSTFPNNSYAWSWGTSMAAPYVTGVAALMMSVNSSLKPQQIRDIIIATVDKDESLAGKCVSGGTLNAYEAVRRANTYTVFDQPKLNGGRAFFTTETPWFDTTTSGRVWPADINGDNRTDIAGIDIDGNICYALANTDGSYTNQRKITVSGGFSASWFSSSYNQRVWFDDVNGDGYDDLMGISVAGKMYAAINKKSFTFGAVTMSSTGTAFRSESAWFSTAHSGRVWTGDINGDDNADFIGISTTRDVYYALGNGSGGFGNETKITMSNSFAQSWFLSTSRPRVWVADVNGDNYDDFIGVSNDGGILTSINNKNYTFSVPTNRATCSFLTSTGWFSTNYTSRVWPADANGDGKCDLVGINVAGDVYIQVNNGSGTGFTQKKVLVVNGYNGGWFPNTSRQRLWPCDINKDGKTDFAGVNANGYVYTSMQSGNFK